MMVDENPNIIRYSDEDYQEFEPAIGQDSIEEISNHIEKHIGEIDSVFHEIISDKVHIDIHIVKPTKTKPYYTLVTSGMSDKPMNTNGEDVNPYMELCICLPKDWKLNHEDFENEANYWPIRQLTYLARFPHDWDTYFSYGHSIPNGDPPEPFADNTEFSSIVFLPPMLVNEEFTSLQINETKVIDFYALIPLYQSELNKKLERGVESLFKGFDKNNVSELLDNNRPDTAVRKKLFGLF